MAEAGDPAFNLDLLSQYAGIGVDPYTDHIGRRIWSEFTLSAGGQRNVSHALGNLQAFAAGDENLTFGFGFRHILRNPQVTETGFNQCALCSALMECFPENYVAAVLTELAKQLDPPLDLAPHVYQWKNLMHACNGAFALSQFGVMVEDFKRLNPYDTPATRSLASPKATAQALKCLASVSSGREKQTAIVAGDIGGFFGVLAEWLLDLRIAICSEDNKQLYATPGAQHTQVTIVYAPKPVAMAYMETHRPASSQNLVVLEAPSEDEADPTTPFGGRVIWQSLLPKVFGNTFEKLVHEEDLGTIIGSASNTFQRLALGESGLVSAENRSTPASYGIGLITTLTNYLPELRRFTGRMERALKTPFDESSKVYTTLMRAMEQKCGCAICAATPTSEVTIAPVNGPTSNFCSPILIETIMALGLALSKMIVTGDLYPTRAGLEAFYTRQAAKKLEMRRRPVRDIQDFVILFGNGWNESDAVRLRDCVAIFSGSLPANDFDDHLVAISHEGICAYLIKYEGSSSSDRPGGSSIVRVVPGVIQQRQKVYDRVRRGPMAVGMATSHLWEEVNCRDIPHAVYCK